MCVDRCLQRLAGSTLCNVFTMCLVTCDTKAFGAVGEKSGRLMTKHFELWRKKEKLKGEFSTSVCHTATIKVGLLAGRQVPAGEPASAVKAVFERHTTLSKWERSSRHQLRVDVPWTGAPWRSEFTPKSPLVRAGLQVSQSSAYVTISPCTHVTTQPVCVCVCVLNN